MSSRLDWLRADCDGPGQLEDSKLEGVLEFPPPEEMTRVIRKERVAQAHWAHICALTMSVTGCLLMLVAVGFFLHGSTAAGALSIAGGVINQFLSTSLFRLNRESSDRLAKIEHDLAVIERAQRSALYASQIISPGTRDDAFRDITKELSRAHNKEQYTERQNRRGSTERS